MATSPDPATRARLEKLFPLLARTHWAIRDKPSTCYNCIAWALGMSDRWCWPDARSFWPIATREVTPDCFAQAFTACGYEQCAVSSAEPGYDKIALYLANGRPSHAARIESDILWSSKLGRAELIEHESNGLNSMAYGLPTMFFRRKR